MAKMTTVRTLYFTSANGHTITKVDADSIDEIRDAKETDNVQGATVIIKADGSRRSSSESAVALRAAMGWGNP